MLLHDAMLCYAVLCIGLDGWMWSRQVSQRRGNSSAWRTSSRELNFSSFFEKKNLSVRLRKNFGKNQPSTCTVYVYRVLNRSFGKYITLSVARKSIFRISAIPVARATRRRREVNLRDREELHQRSTCHKIGKGEWVSEWVWVSEWERWRMRAERVRYIRVSVDEMGWSVHHHQEIEMEKAVALKNGEEQQEVKEKAAKAKVRETQHQPTSYSSSSSNLLLFLSVRLSDKRQPRHGWRKRKKTSREKTEWVSGKCNFSLSVSIFPSFFLGFSFFLSFLDCFFFFFFLFGRLA